MAAKKKKSVKKKKKYTAKQIADRKAADKRRKERDKVTRVMRGTHDAALARDLKIRGTRNAVVRDADLRLRLAGKKIVNKLNWIVDEFSILDENVRDAKNTEEDPYVLGRAIMRSTARGQLLKTQASILFRKLNKLLPDVKSIEFKDTGLKPSKPENLSEDRLIDILKDNVSIDDLINLFPQYSKDSVMKSLEELELPKLAN